MPCFHGSIARAALDSSCRFIQQPAFAICRLSAADQPALLSSPISPSQAQPLTFDSFLYSHRQPLFALHFPPAALRYLLPAQLHAVSLAARHAACLAALAICHRRMPSVTTPAPLRRQPGMPCLSEPAPDACSDRRLSPPDARRRYALDRISCRPSARPCARHHRRPCPAAPPPDALRSPLPLPCRQSVDDIDGSQPCAAA